MIKRASFTYSFSILFYVVMIVPANGYKDSFIFSIFCKNSIIADKFRMMRPTYLLYDETIEMSGKLVTYSCRKNKELVVQHLKPFEKGLKMAHCDVKWKCASFPQLSRENTKKEIQTGEIHLPSKLHRICSFPVECIRDENGFPEWVMKGNSYNDHSQINLCYLINMTHRRNVMKMNSKMFWQASMKSKMKQKEINTQISSYWDKIIILCVLVQTFNFLYGMFYKQCS